MMDALYLPGETVIHRIAAGWKLAFVAGLGTAVFLIDDTRIAAAALVGVGVLYISVGVPPRIAWRQLRFAVPLLVIIFAAQLLLVGWQTGALVVLRFAALILAASLVTLTTRTADMIDALERFLSPLRRLGVDVAKVSLALSLAIRFIPVVAQVTQQIREAQRARGLERSLVAVALPVIVRLLRMADEIADAIEARSYGAVEKDRPAS